MQLNDNCKVGAYGICDPLDLAWAMRTIRLLPALLISLLADRTLSAQPGQKKAHAVAKQAIKQVPSKTAPLRIDPAQSWVEKPIGDSAVESPERKAVFRCNFQPMPEFSGDLPAFILNNLRYPDSANARGIEGRVVLRFLVRKEGQVDSASVVRGVDDELDSAALRLVRIMPRWVPGKLSGKPVDSWFILPITFQLE